ncbi:MAG: gliding motility-associated C-terminal domain-containing protein, partial [Saprospiraceae bacterium]|nr:gliding motility-associated C-terminal domain-containing protein [Saprospiraceae bacterium]
RSFRIFDRWGSLMHERTGVGVNPEAHGWDGFSRGLKCTPGVYVWHAEIEFDNGNVQVLKGDVTLVR